MTTSTHLSHQGLYTDYNILILVPPHMSVSYHLNTPARLPYNVQCYVFHNNSTHTSLPSYKSHVMKLMCNIPRTHQEHPSSTHPAASPPCCQVAGWQLRLARHSTHLLIHYNDAACIYLPYSLPYNKEVHEQFMIRQCGSYVNVNMIVVIIDMKGRSSG